MFLPFIHLLGTMLEPELMPLVWRFFLQGPKWLLLKTLIEALQCACAVWVFYFSEKLDSRDTTEIILLHFTLVLFFVGTQIWRAKGELKY